jgi:hypothetical protein
MYLEKALDQSYPGDKGYVGEMGSFFARARGRYCQFLCIRSISNASSDDAA